jgi:hypothetical protein
VSENEDKVPVGFSEWCRCTLDEWIENTPAEAAAAKQEAIAWLQADERITEAKAVEPCVDLFVETEMQERRQGPGRHTRWTHYAKSLGYRYRRPLAGKVDAEDAAQLVIRTLAVGYAGTIDVEAGTSIRIAAGRTNETIWNYWIVRVLHDEALELLPKQHVAHVEKGGSEMFRRSAFGLGLKPLGRGTMGAQALGGLYVKAGMSLRIAQTIPDEILARDWMQFNNKWPWPGDELPAGE